MKLSKILSISLLGLALAACSDDDPAKVYKANTFTDANGLTLTVNGEPMLGKTVTFTPDVNDGSKGSITLSSTFDLNQIPGLNLTEGNEIAAPGVIPGSKTLTIPLTLAEGSNAATFTGTGDTDYCTFNYKGTVNDEAMTLDITDLVLKNQSLVGKYAPLPFKMDDDFESDTYGQILQSPIYYQWKSTSKFNFLGSETDIEPIISIVLSMGLIGDDSLNVPQALELALKNVEFRGDGNVIAEYLDFEAENATTQLSPANLAQYVVASDKQMLFYLNPQAIDAHENGKKVRGTRADIDFSNVLGNVLAQLAPKMGDGIPMAYSLEGDNMRVYLTTETLLPLLKSVVPMLRNEEFVNKLVEQLQGNDDPMMQMIAGMLPAMVSSLADVIENTTVIEVGINLKK